MKHLVVGCLLVSSFILQADQDFVSIKGLKWNLGPGTTLSNGILRAESKPGLKNATAIASASVDLSDYSFGGFEARIRACGRDIARPPQHYLGLKFMFQYREVAGGGDWFYPGAPGKTGSFDWQTLTCRDIAPGRLRGKGLLQFGLQQTSGVVEFDLSTLEIRPLSPVVTVTNEDYRVSYRKDILRKTPLRGVMLPHSPTERDFADLHEWGVTLVRYQMARYTGGWSAAQKRDVVRYRAWLDGKLDILDKIVLPMAEKYGIQVAVDLHSVPGDSKLIFNDQGCIDEFVDTWRRIARRFKGRKNIYGYDLFNEPAQGEKAICDYWELQCRAAEAIRAVDGQSVIIVESNSMDCPQAFSYLSPLAMDNVIYQVHVYNPGAYTHQGVGLQAREGDGVKWPNEARNWDKEYIRRELKPVLEFQKRHKAKIYVGEFSAIGWAPGAANYLKDAIELFEEFGWDWTYHAFREWNGWSVEHEGVSIKEMRPSESNDRRRVLLDALKGRPIRGPSTARPKSVAFADHAVLQRDRVIPLSGMATPGEKIEVSFAGQAVTAIAAHGSLSQPQEPAAVSSEVRGHILR